MNIILDSNILFSALIKDSITRRMILDYENHFLFPSFIFEEIEKYKEELLKKSDMNPNDFELLFSILLRKVMIIPMEILSPYKKEAYEIVKNIDPNDVIFIACSLAYPNSIIWSDDKKLKQQSKVWIIDTAEMYSFLYGKKKLDKS